MMVRTNFDKETKELAVKDYLGGMSYREVAARYNTDHKTIRKWVIKSGNISRSKEAAYLLMIPKIKGIRKSISTEFKKGLIPWNTGTKGATIPNTTSFKKGIHYSPDTEFKDGDNTGTDSPNWKGDEVGYNSLHSWVYRHKGKAKKCQFCGSEINVQWANKSLEYKRELDDWMELCCKCHRRYDIENGWGKATRKYPELARADKII